MSIAEPSSPPSPASFVMPMPLALPSCQVLGGKSESSSQFECEELELPELLPLELLLPELLDVLPEVLLLEEVAPEVDGVVVLLFAVVVEVES